MKRLVFLLVLLLSLGSTYAQDSRDFVRGKIREWGECRNVAITETNGDLALYGNNGWAGQGLPTGLSNALNEFNASHDYIDDVVLTEHGKWLLLIGDNGFRWSDIPYGLESKLREFNKRGDVVTSVTFNDGGDWILISQEYYVASSSWIMDWLRDGTEKYGALWAACVTYDSMVAVYAEGYKYYGNVPESLKAALRECNRNIYRIKIAGDSWFIADKNGWYRYHM